MKTRRRPRRRGQPAGGGRARRVTGEEGGRAPRMMERRFHPVAAIFPLMQGVEFDALVESIRTKGLLNAIWTHPDDGGIIDSRNRERACARAGVEPRYQEWNGEGSLIDFVVAQNVERRQMNGTQRALLAKKLEPLYAAEAEERQREAGERGKEGGRGKKNPLPKKLGKGKHEGEAAEKAAKAAKTNRQYVSDLKKIEKEAPGVYAKIDAGEIDLRMAKRMMAHVVAEKKLEAAKSVVRPPMEICDLRVCSMQELLAELRNVDAIITDPPYSKEFLPLYGELARLAAKALKLDGTLAVMVPHVHLPQVMAAMCQHVRWWWDVVYLTPASESRVFSRRVNTQHKLVLLFGGGNQKSLRCDVVKSNGADKRFHEWQQSESGMYRLVEMLAQPDELVCDPFLGAGTTAVACVRLSRRFVGCDIDAAAVETARARAALALAPFARKPIPAMLGPWINKIHCADCLEIMRRMPAESVDLVVTSPPYNIRNSTGGGMRNNGGGRWKNCGLLNGYDGSTDDMPHAEYVGWQRECLTEMMRLLKDDGAIFYNHKPRVQGRLWQDRDEIVEGFPVREEIIWERAGAINFNRGYFLPTYEVVYLVCKPRFKLAEGANAISAVWHIPQETGNPHPAPFPLELARRCIESTDAQVVLDPFIGSGTTAVAAEMLGASWIGIERSEKYCDYANERLARIRDVPRSSPEAASQLGRP